MKLLWKALWEGFWLIVNTFITAFSAFLILVKEASFEDYMNVFDALGNPIVDYLLSKYTQHRKDDFDA